MSGRTGEKGITLAELLAAAVLLMMAGAILFSCLGAASRRDKVEACAGHLRTLHKAAAGAPPSPALGGAYWLRLVQAKPPLAAPETLLCPLADDPAEIQYLGPGSDPAAAAADAPLGCDRPSNHSRYGKEGGNILLKSGEVVTDHTGVWSSAALQGKCRP